MNCRNCEICNVDVHRASYLKHLTSKKHLENIDQNEMIISEWFFEEPTENKIKKVYNPKTLRQLARDKIELDDKQLNEQLAKKMNNRYYFTDRNLLKVGFNITLESHHISHVYSKLTITPNYAEFGLEIRHNNKIIKNLSVFYARIINQYKFKYQTVFSARFFKQDEDNQILDETELFNNLNINHDLTESDHDKIDIKSPSKHQIQQQELKDYGWIFDKINSMTVYFCKTGEFNDSNYIKFF